MNDKRVYIPDVSSFFAGDKKYGIKDIMNSLPIEQESVTFAVNDMYDGAPLLNGINNRKRGVQKCRKKRRRRKFHTKFKRSKS